MSFNFQGRGTSIEEELKGGMLGAGGSAWGHFS